LQSFHPTLQAGVRLDALGRFRVDSPATLNRAFLTGLYRLAGPLAARDVTGRERPG